MDMVYGKAYFVLGINRHGCGRGFVFFMCDNVVFVKPRNSLLAPTERCRYNEEFSPLCPFTCHPVLLTHWAKPAL
jgi:hypothetical protein